MVFNSVSETETTPITPPPPQLQPQSQSQPQLQPPQLQPQPAMNSSFVFSATNSPSQPINSSYSAYSNFRWSLNHPHSNPNRLGSIPANNTNSGFLGLRLGPNGFTLGNSGLNPIPGFISSGSSLNSGLRFGSNQTENNIISPGLGFSNPDKVMTEKNWVEEPVEPVEVSDKKGKSKVYGSVRLPARNKGSGSGSGYATDGGENDDVDGGEAEISSDDEDLPNSLKNWNLKEDEEGKKSWNLRPRKALPKPAPPTGGDSRNGGRKGQPSRAKPQQATPTRPRGAAAAAPPRRPMFSISLTKEEIEEDFIKMTGKKPPKKNKRRPKNVQKQMDACFPAVWLRDVTPEKYKVPDPPLKG